MLSRPRTIAVAAALVTVTTLGGALYFLTVRDQGPVAALTSSQAAALADARFADYRNGVTAIDAVIPVSGRDFRLDGRVDWRAGIGYATFAGARQADGTDLLQWTPNGIAVRGGWTGPLPDSLPADGWMVRPWQQGADLDTVLRLILGLGSDRPENAQSVQQSGASVLRRDSIGGEPVTVFAGPPDTATGSAHTRYWVSGSGALRRFEALVDGSTGWTRVDLASGQAPAIPHIPGMP